MFSSWKINFFNLCLGIGLIVGITKATSILSPYGGYFKFSEVLYGVPEPPKWPAILIKFLIPVVVGSIMSFIAFQDNPIRTAGAVGFSGAFILVWPALNDWNTYAHPQLINKEYAFKLVYLLYLYAYYYLAIWGARLTLIYLDISTKQGNSREKIIQNILDWEKSIRPLLYGLTSGGFSFILSQVFSAK